MDEYVSANSFRRGCKRNSEGKYSLPPESFPNIGSRSYLCSIFKCLTSVHWWFSPQPYENKYSHFHCFSIGGGLLCSTGTCVFFFFYDGWSCRKALSFAVSLPSDKPLVILPDSRSPFQGIIALTSSIVWLRASRRLSTLLISSTKSYYDAVGTLPCCNSWD